ncbi:uncharacterized protein LOC124499563 [Dermatophagoides farinae]|uniref:Uncharacterized protein n=1 Tax=Dermatophagoides farinae TaxID=6954 RepID=A0A922L0L1_DERFA|nr:hypothetical protein DERF_013481 [Dermatophagoides farinae]
MKPTNVSLLLFIIVCVEYVRICYARHYPKCHLIEMEKCFDKLHQLKDSQHDPSFLLTSHDGLDKICRVLKQDFTECILAYLKKCGTPLHKELSKVISDAILEHMNKICDSNSEFRNDLLEKSPCIHEKILSQPDYQKECNNPFFTTVAWGEMKAHSKQRERSPIDYAVDAGCCAYRQWELCTMPKIRENCEIDSEDILQNVISKLLGGVTNFLCYQDIFNPESETCTSLPTFDEQIAQVNMTYADEQKFSIFSVVKMFLTRVDVTKK